MLGTCPFHNVWPTRTDPCGTDHFECGCVFYRENSRIGYLPGHDPKCTFKECRESIAKHRRIHSAPPPTSTPLK